ncbi:MAG: methyltransferase domain-containing protein [Dechloromonas sp.]|nr:methyltransferase domain-containing protein [Dechloromonas sp.]
MNEVFDGVAGKFTRDIDQAISEGNYVRGNLFIGLATAAIPAGGYVLDYGCGPGRLSMLLAHAGFRILGCDPSEGMLSQARALKSTGLNMEFKVIRESGETLPQNTFDAIVCSSVIEYVPDPDALLQEFRKALVEKGTLIISFANKSSLWRKYWQRNISSHPMGGVSRHHKWSKQEFEVLLNRNGFRLATQPKYFESPWDHRTWGALVRRLPYFGTLGVVSVQVAST